MYMQASCTYGDQMTSHIFFLHSYMYIYTLILVFLLIACIGWFRKPLLCYFAGRQFFTVEEMLFSAHHASYGESLEAGIHCFLVAIEVRTVHVRQWSARVLG